MRTKTPQLKCDAVHLKRWVITSGNDTAEYTPVEQCCQIGVFVVSVGDHDDLSIVGGNALHPADYTACTAVCQIVQSTSITRLNLQKSRDCKFYNRGFQRTL